MSMIINPYRFASSSTLLDGLVGWWKLDEGSGTLAADSSGNGNDGTLLPFSSEPTWIAGRVGAGALSFDGINDYVSIPNGAALQINNNVSVSLWVYWPTFGTSTWHTITAKRALSSRTNYGFNFHPISDVFQWFYNSSGTFRVQLVNLSANFSTGVWTHVVGRFGQSGVNTSAQIFKNGSQLVTGTLLENVAAETTVPVNLGVYGATGEPAAIYLDDVRIYNRVLTTDEIAELAT